ncbi:MAG: hypothetical protein Q7T78_00700 [Rhodoferax sp.]|nr:hypothetical protein [Rhodoferax sp.]
MFAGHVGAALIIGRAEKSVNIGIFALAALLLDALLWLFVLAGWESVAIPANFAGTHQPEFVFPYSHGLVASVVWSLLASETVFTWHPGLLGARLRAAAFVAAAVFSHWLLDALVHVPELPLAGANSMKVGLGLWQNMPVALAVESAIVVVGLFLYVPSAWLSRGKKLWLTALSISLLVFTVLGMTVAPAPPSVTAMAASSLASIALVCALIFWLGASPKESRA